MTEKIKISEGAKVGEGTKNCRLPLYAVSVAETNNGSEYHHVGRNDVTAVLWGEQAGHMAMLPTIQVFKNDKLFSEHPFTSVPGVYFEEPK